MYSQYLNERGENTYSKYIIYIEIQCVPEKSIKNLCMKWNADFDSWLTLQFLRRFSNAELSSIFVTFILGHTVIYSLKNHFWTDSTFYSVKLELFSRCLKPNSTCLVRNENLNERYKSGLLHHFGFVLIFLKKFWSSKIDDETNL